MVNLSSKHTSVQNAFIVDIYNEKKDGKLNKGNKGGRIHIEAKDNRKREDFRSSRHPAPPHVTHYFRRWWAVIGGGVSVAGIVFICRAGSGGG
ncbi:hypothetical protein HID58_075451, partial [Brassica napus]